MAWNIGQVAVPFYVYALGPAERATTLQWSGWITGVTPLMTILATPVWVRLGARSPKWAYIVSHVLQSGCFVFMGSIHSLGSLLIARIALGCAGAASVFAFVVAGQLERTNVRNVAAVMHAAMMIGPAIGPLIGAAVIVRYGMGGSFLVGGALLAVCAVLLVGLVLYGNRLIARRCDLLSVLRAGS